jgi:hypothetical protein
MISAAAVVYSSALLVSFVLGSRLLLGSLRTRRISELTLGLALLGMGSVGYAFHIAARLPGQSRLTGTLLVIAAISLQAVGTGSLFYFVWHSFRPRDAWAKGFAFFCYVLLSVSTAGDGFSRALSGLDGWGPWYWLGLVVRLTAVSWAAWESLRAYRSLRGRAHAELGDPMATHGLLLLGLGASAATGGAAIAIAARFAFGVSVVRVPFANLCVCLLILTACSCAWLALFPPPAYRRLLQRLSKRSAPTEPEAV